MYDFYRFVLKNKEVSSSILRRFLISASLGNLFFKLFNYSDTIPSYDFLTLILIFILGLRNIEFISKKRLICYLILSILFFIFLSSYVGVSTAGYALFLVIFLITLVNIFIFGLQSRVSIINIDTNYIHREKTLIATELISTLFAFIGFYLSYLDKN